MTIISNNPPPSAYVRRVQLKCLAIDCFYSEQKFVDSVVALDLQMISKLRTDANMCYIYSVAQKPRSTKRKYDGNVDWNDLIRFTHVRQLNPYTLIAHKY